MPARLHYAQPSGTVVVSQNDQEVLRYASVDALIETHIKGLLVQSLTAGNKDLFNRLDVLYHQLPKRQSRD